MPSVRAVLADITDLGLHPADHHRVVGMNGRLRGAMGAAVASAEAVVEKVETVVKAGLVKLEEKVVEVVEEVKTEVVKVEAVVEETTEVETIDTVTDETPDTEKKSKRGKKSNQ